MFALRTCPATLCPCTAIMLLWLSWWAQPPLWENLAKIPAWPIDGCRKRGRITAVLSAVFDDCIFDFRAGQQAWSEAGSWLAHLKIVLSLLDPVMPSWLCIFCLRLLQCLADSSGEEPRRLFARWSLCLFSLFRGDMSPATPKEVCDEAAECSVRSGGVVVGGWAKVLGAATTTCAIWAPSGGTNSWAPGINASGQVVGYSETSGSPHAFLYSSSGAGTMTDLGTLGGDDSYAVGINASGQVVGYSHTGSEYHAFLYSGGTMNDLDTLGGSESYASAINSSGQVVGYSYTTNDAAYHAFRYSGGIMNDIGTLGGAASYAYGINFGGQVVGQAQKTGLESHAFVYSSGSGMTDLGTLPDGSTSGATGINASGQIVGYSDSGEDSNLHAFLYSGATMTDLGVLPGTAMSVALGINASGQVVGVSSTNDGDDYAFLYSGGMIDLNCASTLTTTGHCSKQPPSTIMGRMMGRSWATDSMLATKWRLSADADAARRCRRQRHLQRW